MKQGKLTNDQLKEAVLGRLVSTRGETVLGPGVGEDCAALDLQGDLVVLTTDPITAADAGAGGLGIHVSCNDLASCGAEPVGVLLTLLCPENTGIARISQIEEDARRACEALGIDILGGHTEVTAAVNKLILSVTAIGRVHRERLITSSGMSAGDTLIMTKWAGLEGTLILLSDHADFFRHKVPSVLTSPLKGLENAVSVVPEGLIAAENNASAMHDVTEGGVLGAAYEMALASGCGVEINIEDIPVLPITRALTAAAGLNVYRLISSGVMLIATSRPGAMLKALEKADIHAAAIGRAVESGFYTLRGGAREKMDPPGPDEIYKMPSK
ncbi:MAG: AIR synthase family protein [Christensenellales bacterium]|jgi:hydrogenase expression/formation protein HypE